MTFHLELTLLFINCWLFFASGAPDGVWDEWSEWSPCSVSCGRGAQKRFRACAPPSRPGGKWCEGKYVDDRECDTGARCPVNGNWSPWSEWGRCSVSCGQGSMERYRSCSNPFPEEGGRNCVGKPSQSQSCTAVRECPRDGGWSPWSQWSRCSVTCGTGGSINRYHSCNNPPPAGEGLPCQGPEQETQPCKAPIPCPVNGQWSEWSDWTECSVSCGTGSRSRQRACDHPPPLFGGDDCDRGDAAELQTTSCTADPLHCPVNGGWSKWSDWKECRSPDCGSPAAVSRSFRHRSCNNPRPAHNGSMCDGPFVHAGLCEQPLNCKVDGGWGEWGEWNCTGSRTVAVRLRACDSPAPANGGKRCKGTGTEFLAREEDREAYLQACLQKTSDDEDFSEGSGNQVASGFGSSFDED